LILKAFIFALIILTSLSSFAQDELPSLEDEKDIGRAIDLRSTLEEAYRKNPLEQIRSQSAAIIDLQKQDLAEKFWFPTVSLDVASDNQRYDRLHTSQLNNPSTGSEISPAGSIGVNFQNYKLFNWGRDYLEYLNSKNTLSRADQRLKEARRRLKFNIITQYFNLIRVKDILKVYRDQLRQASFINRLAREKLALRRISSQDYYQTRADYLRSQTEYQEALFNVSLEEEKMANLLGDEYRTSYRPTEQLKFTTLTTNIEDSIRLGLDQSPAFRDAKLEYDNASRSYDKALKDNLPLPSLNLSLGTYQQAYNRNGHEWSRQTYNGGSNVELIAAIDMKWTLLGEGGFFNNRTNKNSYLEKRIAEIKFYNTKREVEVRIKTLFKTIKFLEQKVTISDYQYKNGQSNLDATLDNYTSGRTQYPDMRLSLDSYVNASINYYNVKFNHMLRKLELSDLMGLEDLPGENFELLATR
jgi:outer membrane protein TolC